MENQEDYLRRYSGLEKEDFTENSVFNSSKRPKYNSHKEDYLQRDSGFEKVFWEYVFHKKIKDRFSLEKAEEFANFVLNMKKIQFFLI